MTGDTLTDYQEERLRDLLLAVAVNEGEPVDERIMGAKRTYARLIAKGYVVVADTAYGPRGAPYALLLPSEQTREWWEAQEQEKGRTG